MKTIHQSTNVNTSTFGTCLLNDMREAGIRGSCRIIRCGAGLVILPDTDRSKDATEGEVIKALGFRNKIENMPPEGGRTIFAVNRQGEFTTMISLTPAQVRFLNWCESEDIFCDEVDFSIQKSPVIKI